MTEAALHLPPHQSAPRRVPRAWLGLLGVALAAGLWWWCIGRKPVHTLPAAPVTLHASPDSPLRRAIAARGVLPVALRSYPRPSLPHAPLDPEPDVLDLAYAQWLAGELGVPVQWTAPAQALLQLQEHATPVGSLHHASGYGETHLQLLVLRQQLPRWRSVAPSAWQAMVERWAWLAPLSALLPRSAPQHPPLQVCLAEGLAPASALQARGWRIQPARSSVHAISNFLAGQCDALAESPAVIARLLSQPSWRFYAALGERWAVGTTTDAAHATSDDAWLAAMHQRWLHSPARQQALRNRSSTIALEASMLEDGAICH